MTIAAIVGSGNIGTDLMYKLLRSHEQGGPVEPRWMVGVDPESEGLQRAADRGLVATHEGVDWLLKQEELPDLVFEATSAYVHREYAPRYAEAGIRAVALTPAAVGPAVIPPVNLEEHLDVANVNMITCGGQATIPMVAAVTRVSPVPYAEIVSTVASRSAGPGTRANIDEFTQTTASGLVEIGGAAKGKAIIILNPAEPPILMRNTVYCALPVDADRAAIEASVHAMAADVAGYAPGYRVKGIVFDDGPFTTPGGEAAQRVTVLLEVTGVGDYLPPYAGNLDIMTASAVRVGETLAAERFGVG